MNMQQFQSEVRRWTAHNFGHATQRDTHQPLLGVVEEVGELSHAHLKIEQGIRTAEALDAQRFDAIGDIVVYLADYCNLVGFNLELAIETAWNEVQKRDWKQWPETGRPPEIVHPGHWWEVRRLMQELQWVEAYRLYGRLTECRVPPPSNFPVAIQSELVELPERARKMEEQTNGCCLHQASENPRSVGSSKADV